MARALGWVREPEEPAGGGEGVTLSSSGLSTCPSSSPETLVLRPGAELGQKLPLWASEIFLPPLARPVALGSLLPPRRLEALLGPARGGGRGTPSPDAPAGTGVWLCHQSGIHGVAPPLSGTVLQGGGGAGGPQAESDPTAPTLRGSKQQATQRPVKTLQQFRWGGGDTSHGRQ